MDRMLNLSNLCGLLHDTLLITEEVKEVLKSDCDEAAFVLKPWQVKAVVEKRADESFCNCKKIASEHEAEEIAAGIGRAIILAQELREKLKLNVASKKTTRRRDTIESIYSSSSTSSGKKVSRNNATQKVNTAKSPDCKKSTTLQSDKVTSVAARKPSLPKSVGRTQQSSATDKKIHSKISPVKQAKSVAAKSRKEKNFILENKLKVKRISSANKLQDDDNNSNNTPRSSQKSVTPEASAAELSDLIHKMRRSTEIALIPSSDSNKKPDCPLHGANAHETVQELITTIDVVEALHHFDVPNEIVKVLRTYQAFLASEASDDSNDIKEDKGRKSMDAFLSEFEAMNIATQDYLLQEPRLLETAAESISAFSNAFDESFDSIQFNDTRDRLAELEAASKRYNIEDIVKPIIERSPCDLPLARGWMSNGIWNTSCMEHVENFSKVYNIMYCNTKQLSSLYELVQKLQRTNYLNTLIEIILRDILPAVKSNIDPTSAEYARAYKTIFILSQGLNPDAPVLVRTDM